MAGEQKVFSSVKVVHYMKKANHFFFYVSSVKLVKCVCLMVTPFNAVRVKHTHPRLNLSLGDDSNNIMYTFFGGGPILSLLRIRPTVILHNFRSRTLNSTPYTSRLNTT